MEDYQPEADRAFVVCRETNLLPKCIFDVFLHCHGLICVYLVPNMISHSEPISNSTSFSTSQTASNAKSQGRKTAYVKFSDASSAQKAIDNVDGQIICHRRMELSYTASDLDEVIPSGADTWNHTDQARWGRGNNALVASMLKVLSTKQTYDSDNTSPRKLEEFKALYDEEVKRLSGFFPNETMLRRQRRVCQYFKYEVSISYHQLLEARKATKSPQDLDLSHTSLSEQALQNLLIDFRLFASRVEHMRFLRTTVQLVIDLPARKDEISTRNLFMVGDYLAETNRSLELPMVFQERMYRCLHDHLDQLYAGEVEVDLFWDEEFEKAILKADDAA
ncbi:hypothetical protein BKA64DRAFT_681013 [Cadophora sp. MPI-SDFR-AT-0126]|nr:hypothetical protein BKA64DRAFT_681013 [Leotiomycetes sp. MPI-SDFR-AT-0126]